MIQSLRHEHTLNVCDTLKYVKHFSGETLLIKLGGAVMNDPELMAMLCEDLALIRSVGISLVLVHGGGPAINEELKAHDLSWTFEQGQRVTTPEMMKIVEMVLCGGVNGQIVRNLNRFGVEAVGISGTDASTFECSALDQKLGMVGNIEKVNTKVIETILCTQSEQGQGLIPVVAPIGLGEKGEAYNINADWAACHLAIALGVQKVLYLTDQDGILDETGQLLSELDAAKLSHLMEDEVVSGGMYAKVKTVLYGLQNGVKNIHLINGKRKHGLIEELFTSGGIGTICQLRSG